MEGGLGLIGGGGGGGGISSGGSTNGSVSTVTKAVEQDYSFMGSSTEVCSSYQSNPQTEAELELGLGLSLGGGIVSKSITTCSKKEHGGRILSVEDLGSIGSAASSFSSSGRGSCSNNNGSSAAVAGTKRTADSVPEPATNTAASQVVGWPPIRAYRMNSLVNQVKVSSKGDNNLKKKVTTINCSSNDDKNNTIVKENGRNLWFVKVNMDGERIGRKVDLNAHTCYDTLAQALEEMFHKPTIANFIRSNGEKEFSSKLLDGSSDFVLTYEDREGDWMLVGDVPWGMFLNTAKRLRIMRTSEMNGLEAPRFEYPEKQMKKPI
ncbi:hypothetical protein C5167_016464 [Papaver somniferum]|uniref:auxin-responsive protein IAA12-like n=1 Tax=Papaver somniferum TaxID=3469 RepID=UPI000E6FDAC2|nr:auxin-responsive protein IAA12-like [Papaver somniferum]XP_026435896.1 auxin-responsive protein IAA12-like [Papaver somniferum]RZC88602.1 hypothetical protein C5167_016464 [Papaver somniferum]